MRVSKRIVAEQFVPTSTTPPSDVGIYRVNRKALGVTGRIDTFDPETKVLSSLPQTLFQSGLPLAILPGDGGSNGLNFTGTRGVFTLNAASPFANSYTLFASGGYVYLPAGAGGLASEGLYWFVMTSDTDGEVFAETHVPGSGPPIFYASPTQMANRTSGRITQTTSEITVASFTIPGGAIGSNGKSELLLKILSTSSAGTKTFRLTVGGQSWFRLPVTTTYNDQVLQSSRINMGVQNRQVGNRTNSTSGGWDSGVSATTFSGDVTTVDTSVPQVATLTMQLGVNTDAMIIVPMQFNVHFAA